MFYAAISKASKREALSTSVGGIIYKDCDYLNSTDLTLDNN
jgi:hypothetical protein